MACWSDQGTTSVLIQTVLLARESHLTASASEEQTELTSGTCLFVFPRHWVKSPLVHADSTLSVAGGDEFLVAVPVSIPRGPSTVALSSDFMTGNVQASFGVL